MEHSEQSEDTSGPIERPVIVLSTANYDADVWTNKQFVASKLAEDRDVFYVNSIGLRRPGLNKSDVRRIFSRIRSLLKFGSPALPTDNQMRHVPARMTVINPTVIPLHNLALIRRINSALLKTQLQKQVPNLRDSILWTFSPLSYGVEKLVHGSVYHSVDLLHRLDKVPTDTLVNSERNLVGSVDAIVASSTGVRDHLVSLGAEDVALWENVADTELYINQVDVERRPAAVFAGNLTPQKINLRIISALIGSGARIDIAGPIDIDGTADAKLTEALDRDNVHYHGNLAPHDLAKLLNSATVGLIPYALNEYTKGVFPLKVYEYLASGLHIVATNLPSLSAHGDIIDIQSEEDAFVSAVVGAMAVPDDETVALRRKRADSNSWGNRMISVRQLVASLQ